GWSDALSVDDPTNDTQGGAGADITNMLITNDGTFLYVAVLFRDSSWYPGISDDGLINILFISTNDMTGTNVLKDVYSWINANQTNEAPFDFFLLYNSKSSTPGEAWGVLNTYDNNPIENWSNTPTNWLAQPKPVSNAQAIEFRIKLSALGLNTGDNIKVGFSVVNTNHTSNYEYETVGTNDYSIIPMIQYQIQ
ncbi:MAG: hypothetical protein RMJ37_05935, partial [Spirochaetia bacterium]|nr:hypothetical protein [Spirochaetota bacterium]MDW8112855.1 hypothetical protein [Spirochaetia bacterium]